MEKKESFSNILIRMPRFVGDCVMATATLTDVRKAFPKAKITVMVVESMASMFQSDKDIDDILTYNKPKGLYRREQKRMIIENIKMRHFDCGILLTNSFSSAFWFWQARIPARVGYAKDGRRLFLTHRVDPLPSWQSYHIVDQYKMVLKGLDIKRSRTVPRLHLTDEDLRKAFNFLTPYGVTKESLLLGINATAATSVAKWWEASSFIKVAKKLEAQGFRLVFFGDEASTPRVNEICKELPKSVINVSGKTNLKELISLIKRCDVVLSGDSGPMHIAAAVQTPVVALFGATNELLSGPYTNLATIVNKHVECSPCFLASCPIDHRCMTRITVDEVFEKIIEWAERSSKYRESTYVAN